MPSYNKVMVMGHLTRDLEMKFTPGGMAVASFGMACNRKFKDGKTGEMREDVTFIEMECWSKAAETLNQYVKKGSALFVEGRLKLDTWDDKSTGQKRSKLKVVVENFQFVGGKSEAGGAGAGASARVGSKKVDAQQTETEDLDIQEDSVPF